MTDLDKELNALIKERDDLVEYANFAFEDYFKNKKPEVLVNVVDWFLDHSERFEEYKARVEAFEYKSYISWH